MIDIKCKIIMSGIYRITNVVTGVSYIGSSVSTEKRWGQHKRSLRRCDHCNEYLQKAWNKYGESSFLFEHLVDAPELGLEIHEQKFIDAYRNHGLELYNLQPSAGSRTGFRYEHSEKSRLKMSDFHKSRLRAPHSLETRAKIGKGQAGIPRLSLRGKPLGVEHRIKIGLTKIGIARSPETRMKISLARQSMFDQLSAALKGKIPGAETREKMSNAQKKRWKLYRDGQV